jgi:hypothetical protein
MIMIADKQGFVDAGIPTLGSCAVPLPAVAKMAI